MARRLPMTDAELNAILRVFDTRSRRVERNYLKKIAMHLRSIGELLPSDVYKIREMRRMHTSLDEIMDEINKTLQADVRDIEKVLLDVARTDAAFMNVVFRNSGNRVELQNNAPLLRTLMGIYSATAGSMQNLSNTTIDDSLYRDAVDTAIHAVTTRVADYQSQIRDVIRRCVSHGLQVVYPSGHRRRLDTAVRQNVLDGIRAVNRDVMEQIGQQFGANGIELSAHALCAEDHLPYQGRQYTDAEYAQVQAALAAGKSHRQIGMWNCKHFTWPIIVGVSKPKLTQQELEDLNRKSSEEITIGGKTLSRYQWTQVQRRLETEARKANDEATTLRAAGDEKGAREADLKARGIVQQYTNISAQANLEPQYTRMRGAIDRRKNQAFSRA